VEYAKKKRPFSSMNAFLYGALSKALATIFTYPLQVAQTRLRVRIPSDNQSKENMFSVLTQLYNEKALLKGCQAKLAQTVLTAAFMFAFYERISQIIFSLLKNRSRK
jgi:adenine nucleotide transporter 17